MSIYEEVDEIRDEVTATLRERYDVYQTQAESLGWDVKDFDEWLNS